MPISQDTDYISIREVGDKTCYFQHVHVSRSILNSIYGMVNINLVTTTTRTIDDHSYFTVGIFQFEKLVIKLARKASFFLYIIYNL